MCGPLRNSARDNVSHGLCRIVGFDEDDEFVLVTSRDAQIDLIELPLLFFSSPVFSQENMGYQGCRSFNKVGKYCFFMTLS